MVRVLFLSLLMSTFAFGAEPGDDEDMIQSGQPEQEVWLVETQKQITVETHDMEVLTVPGENGQAIPAVVVATDKETGKQSFVGLGETADEAIVRAHFAIRLKFPELVGVRGGLTVYDLVEMGFDIGIGIFFNNVGWYLNVYPLANMKKWYSNFYAGVRWQNEGIWAILGTMSGKRAEAVVGYRFDTKKGRFYWMLEAGYGKQIGTMKTSAFGYSGTSDDPLPLPVIGLGFGINISSKHPRHR